MPHLYEAHVKKNPVVHIFARRIPYVFTSYISFPSYTPPLRDNKNGNTILSVAKAVALDVGHREPRQLFRRDIFADSSKGDIQSE